MKLILAEKPSVAQSIAKVLGATKRGNGYLEGNGYIVSWCIGHLVELAQPERYDERYSKWQKEDLPILPDNWKYQISAETKKQFLILKQLMERPDVESLVCATDAGREGELIFRLVYHQCKCKKSFERLWISSMEDTAIKSGFANLKPGTDYDDLYEAALCRAKADWLVGINATRFFSVLYHRTLNVGRVMSPTLALLVQREADISAFKPVPFYTPFLDCGGFSATGEKCAEKAAAQAVVDACKGQPALVQTVEQKEKSERPPAMYDLTTLQRDANRQLGYTAQQTLDYLQTLYEKKLCTYPRTDSRYLTADMEGTVPALAAVAAKICGVAVPDTVLAAQVCNNAKVTDHHAIVPTEGAGRTDLEALPAGEREILRLVARGLLCATGTPYRYQETVVILDCGGNLFSAKGKAVIDPGWKVYQREIADMAKESVLPNGLTEGKTLPVTAVSIKEGKTTAPKHYTEDTLLSAMEMAGTKDKVNCSSGAREGGRGRIPEDAERKGIGTPATRAGILEKLVSTGFVERKKQKKTTYLIPTQIGVSLITVLPEQLQSPLLTAEWEHQLKEVERGEMNPNEFMDGICNMLHDLVRTYKMIDGSQVLFPSARETVGRCPRCGGAVTERKQGFFCENTECRFALWKNSKFFTVKKKNLTRAVASALLKDGKAKLTGCYSEKTGKTYDATVLLEDTGEKTNFKLLFEKK